MKPHPNTAQIIADYLAGASLRTLARRYACSHTQIATLLEANNVPRRERWAYLRLRICTTCGCSFQPKREGQERCSEDCRPGRHKPTCKHGHPLTPENLTPRYGREGPRCRACIYIKQAQYRARKEQAKWSKSI